jgi:ABC-type transport system involved in cytochrome c biogenesis permease subunit
MKSFLILVLGAYIVAAVHAVLAFLNKRRILQRVSWLALVAGFALHSVALLSGWALEGRFPLFYLPETLSFLAWSLVAAYGLLLYRYQSQAQALGSFTLPLVAALVLISIVTGSHASAALGTPGEIGRGWIFPFHTTALICAYASFFVVFVASVMYLLQERELKLKTFGAIFHRLPPLTTVNDIATAATTVGLTLLSLGIVTGMIWSSERDGKLWHNDPKEIFAALTWLLYLLLIIYRASARWRGRRAAWLGVAGFALVLCTFLGARLLGGYHDFG